MASNTNSTSGQNSNPDPITGAPGSHPVGTGVGAAGGGLAGAAAGAAIGSAVPGIGTVIGGAVGAVVGATGGGYAGKGVAESINPTAEDAYWRDNYKTRSYITKGTDYSTYQPAYRYGWESRQRYAGRSFEQAEPELRQGWAASRGQSTLDWDRAKLATRDAWDRIDQASTGQARQMTEGEVKVPVMEEQLEVGKRQVEKGGVRVQSRVTERPVEESVNLREEKVRVERRPVDRPASEADFNRAATGSMEVREMAEQPVVSKQARVVEEVVVNKEVQQREQTVRDTVRRTDVKVEQVDRSDTSRTDKNRDV